MSVHRLLTFARMQVRGRAFEWSNISPDTGSNVIVAGTAIFGAEDPEGVIQQLKTTVNRAQAVIASKQS